MGYVTIEVIRDNILSKRGYKMRAHIFRWSCLEGIPEGQPYAYRVRRNEGKVFYDGLIQRNVLAGYAHLHFTSDINLVKSFIRNCRQENRLRR